ncbi:NucA/NucB deoxyribonuclease domain-containing protein [Saccharothrix sp. Mg75]|uniref:NucA/NucB deoxyribonuclease domain-containing protein n=1 Tax=Saccharothrix sp. Mg75 TaxID=3445357 RepID=UPI003EEFE615
MITIVANPVPRRNAGRTSPQGAPVRRMVDPTMQTGTPTVGYATLASRYNDQGDCVGTKSIGAVLPLVVLAAAAFVVAPEAVESGLGWLAEVNPLAGGVELVGEGDVQFMVAASASAQVDKCTPKQSLAAQACDDLKFVVLDAAKMPFITRNVSEAWRAGKPGVLTKDSAAEPENRKQVCLRTFPRPHGGQCDEYPFASTREGGQGALEMEVPPRENACQGGTLRAHYGALGINDGDSFLVAIIHPTKIAQGPYTGTDIAEESAC